MGRAISETISQYVDIASIPPMRALRDNGFVDRIRAAVTFEMITVSGLDLANYEFGNLRSIDSDFPPSFLEAYRVEGLHKVDPLVLMGQTAIAAVREQDAHGLYPMPPRLQSLLDFHQIRNRTLFPLHRGERLYGAVTFTRSAPFADDEIDFLTTMAPIIHFETTKPLMERFAATNLKLTAGELACLGYSSEGFTSEEVSKKTGYQTDTVNTYLRNAARKLGSKNKTQAVAEAIRRRLMP